MQVDRSLEINSLLQYYDIELNNKLGSVAVEFRAVENRSRLFLLTKKWIQSQNKQHWIYCMYAEFKSILLIILIFQDQC
jgi:hypothetical protein